MNTLVVYDSTYGNTEQIAQAIGEAIGSQVVRVGGVRSADLRNYDLLIVGSPTHGGWPTEAIDGLLKESLPLDGVKVAAFDTRTAWSPFGNAATRIARGLQRSGAKLLAPPEGFTVRGMQGPLKDGERERAAAWAKELAG